MAASSALTIPAAPAGAAPPAPAQAVIVLLKDQLPDLPVDPQHLTARQSKSAAAQHAVLNGLGGSRPEHVRDYTTVNGFAAAVTPAQATALAADPAVAAVIPDRTVEVTPPKPGTAPDHIGAHARPAQPAAPSQPPAQPAAPSQPPAPPTAPSQPPAPPAGACPDDAAKPLLEPEALQVTRDASNDSAPTAQQLADGSGVTVAYIADGIDPNLPDFVRPDGSKVIVDYRDFSGDGPDATSGGGEAFGDASAIAAQGRTSFDLADYVNPAYPLPRGCTIRVLGMAPGASVVALKAGGEQLPNSAVLQAIDWAVTVDHVDVLNESFGANTIPDDSTRDTIQLFNRAAVAAGVTVTVSSGDAGVTGTIGTPATDPNVISVGASTTYRLYAQTGYGAFNLSRGTWANDNISALSSGGITQGGDTIDLVAPGDAGWALCSPSPRFTDCTNLTNQPSPIQVFGGTSQSAPLTAGAAALAIQAYRSSHRGASPSPATVKQLLLSTTRDLGLPAEEQGTGLLDARAAVEAALTADQHGQPPPGVASNVLLTPNQFDLTGHPGQEQTVTVGVTNVGAVEQTVAAGTRKFATVASATQTLALAATTDPTSPYFNGANWAYRLTTFTVPPSVDRLEATIAWQGSAHPVGSATVTPAVRLMLIDPDGRYQAHSRPQGGAVSANHAFVDVRRPPPGTWTAVITTLAGANGYTGPVQLATATQRAVPAGSASPPVLRLQPGQHGELHVRVTTPTSGGDASASITIGSSDGHLTSIPVVLRSLVPLSAGVGRFDGTITGGNARAGAPAQTETFAFDVPAGHRTLGVGLTLANDPNVVLNGVLVDPDGEPVDIGTNATFEPTTGTPSGPGRSMQLTTADPVAGRWRFVLAVQNPVSGAELAQDFTGQITLDQVVDVSSTLPTQPSQELPAGTATTATVTYTNRGVAPVLLQADARMRVRRDLQLAAQGASGTLLLPQSATTPTPSYLVPPGTDRVTLAASATTPVQVELSGPAGGIDAFGDLRQGQHGGTVSVAEVAEPDGRTVAHGQWQSFVQQIGPFAAPAPAGSAVLTATASTQAFDPDVTSSTGDPWTLAVDPTASPGRPVVVDPGQTVTITVTITPSAERGQRVAGTLYLVTPPLAEATFTTGGDVLAAIPYGYTVT